MNNVILHGRLTKTPEMRYTQTDTPLAIATFGLAVRRDFAKEGGQNVDFFNCTAFGKTGENIEKFFRKGDGIVIRGRIQNDTYKKDDGSNVTLTKIIVEGFDFAEKVQAPQGAAESENNIVQDDDDEELPF